MLTILLIFHAHTHLLVCTPTYPPVESPLSDFIHSFHLTRDADHRDIWHMWLSWLSIRYKRKAAFYMYKVNVKHGQEICLQHVLFRRLCLEWESRSSFDDLFTIKPGTLAGKITSWKEHKLYLSRFITLLFCIRIVLMLLAHASHWITNGLALCAKTSVVSKVNLLYQWFENCNFCIGLQKILSSFSRAVKVMQFQQNGV